MSEYSKIILKENILTFSKSIDITDYLIEKNRYITGSNININGGII